MVKISGQKWSGALDFPLDPTIVVFADFLKTPVDLNLINRLSQLY